MAGRIALVLLLLAVTVALAVGCASESTGTAPRAGGGGGSNERIRPSWIGADVLSVDGGSLMIPTSAVSSGKMLHFSISTGQYGKQNFMAYDLGGEKHVRANVCPPCRSVGFSLVGDILVCDSCGTRFEAATGAGISGACRDFPKAEVEKAIGGGDITVEIADLVTAYENTEKPGWP
jgi:nitrite reductase/ring-hydroxylating ferredoxin subunit